MTVKRRRDQAFLTEIARQYNAHCAANWPPVRAIAVAYGVSHATATKWIAACRDAGLYLANGHQVRHRREPIR
jgi:hypothetical protein